MDGSIHYDNITDAIRKVNELVKGLREEGHDLLHLQVGGHLNPGDVYDAYEAIGLQATVDHTLAEDRCGPFAAVYLHQHPSSPPSEWLSNVQHTYNERYVDGFLDGFKLSVPQFATQDLHYLRGVYDGVMANAAVF